MAEGMFRVFLRVYPRAFRERYGEEMMEFFRAEWVAVRKGPAGLLFFWWKTLRDGLGVALRLRLRARERKGRVEGPGGKRKGPGEDPSSSLGEGLLQDVRFALRTLRKQPGFTFVAVGVLGLGIGASTTLFSAVSGVLLRPLPYPEQDHLVVLGSIYPGGERISGMSIPELMDVMAEVEGVEALAAVRGRALDLVGNGEPERVAVVQVSPEYFRVLGTGPVLGPGFSPESYATVDGEGDQIMVSHGLWQRRWGGDPEIIGKRVLASDGRTPGFRSYTIVGVLPRGFENPPPLENPYSRLPAAELWAPLPLGSEMYTTPRTNYTVRSVGLLREGWKLDPLNAELDALARSLTDLYPEAHVRRNGYLGLGARPLLEVMVGARGRDLMILFGATGLLLLIACANVAGLLVARSLDRVGEMSLRGALGARRGRLFRQLLTESVVLALMGGGLGLLVAALGVEAFHALGPASFPRMHEIELDPGVLTFGMGVALVTGVVFGVGPAMVGSRFGWGVAVGSRQRSTAGRGTLRLRGGLVAVEVALAMVLLTGCGLLTRSILQLQERDPGVDTEGLALMQVRLLPSYDEDAERRAFYESLQEKIRGLSGVVSASFVADPPMDFANWAPNLWREEDASSDEPSALGIAHPVGLGYFETMGIPLLQGRAFAVSDDEGSVPVAVVSQTFAHSFWPEEDPLGKRIGLSIDHDGTWVTVVGVVGDIRQRTLVSEPGMDFYLPFRQWAGTGGQYMVVRTERDPQLLAPSLREAVWALDDRVPVPEITSMKIRVDGTLRLPRFRMYLLGAFALTALLLAGAGVYGTLLYTVGRRTTEVGIRMALGAEAPQVVGMLLRQGMVPVGAGLLLGLAGSFGATRLLESVLFQVSPTDPWTFVLMASVLLTVGVVASYLPARMASRVEPQAALQAD